VPRFKRDRALSSPPFPPSAPPSSNQAHGRRHLTPSTSRPSQPPDHRFPYQILSSRRLQGELYHSIVLTPECRPNSCLSTPLSCRTHRLPLRFIGASLPPSRTVTPSLSATSRPPRIHGELLASRPCSADSPRLSGAYLADLAVRESPSPLNATTPELLCHILDTRTSQ
jgi:hypothetical protein